MHVQTIQQMWVIGAGLLATIGATIVWLGIVAMRSTPGVVESYLYFFGILATAIRVLSRIRRYEAAQWERAHELKCIYGAKGKSCERAIWQQAASVESAKAIQASSASALIDMEKML